MQANYRIVKIGKKYYPQTRFQHVVTSVKNADIQPIHDWIYFKDTNGEDMWYDTYEQALNACAESDKEQIFDEVIEVVIDHGKIIEEQKIIAV